MGSNGWVGFRRPAPAIKVHFRFRWFCRHGATILLLFFLFITLSPNVFAERDVRRKGRVERNSDKRERSNRDWAPLLNACLFPNEFFLILNGRKIMCGP